MSRFRVRVLGFEILKELQGSWTSADFAALLDAVEFGDTRGMSDAELREMGVMSLQDLEPAHAAALLLEHVLGDVLTDGQIQNAANEMLDEKLWEEYADMSLHERMFKVGSLLYAVFPRSVPEPDAVAVNLDIIAAEEDAEAELARPLHESLLVRLLADGMDERAALHRLFEPQLVGKSFPEAETIVWVAQTERSRPGSVQVDVIGSGYWLDALRSVESYESNAEPDAGK